jgi:hypothetical protein
MGLLSKGSTRDVLHAKNRRLSTPIKGLSAILGKFDSFQLLRIFQGKMKTFGFLFGEK